MGLGAVISSDSASSTHCDYIPILSVCVYVREFVCFITEENSKVLVYLCQVF